MRLDFNNFVITGPDTVTTSVAKTLAPGIPIVGKKYSYSGTCLTDVFTVSGTSNVPPLCSTLTGEHGKVSLFYVMRPI